VFTIVFIAAALAGLSVAFAGAYVLARRLDNYGIVDIAWSYAFAPLAIFYAASFREGWLPRRVLIATLAVLWSLRLGIHLHRRVMRHHPVEDGRYQQLRRDWNGNLGRKMAGFFQLQAASVVLLGIPFLLPALNPTPAWSLWEGAGVLLWLGALAGEALADAQLAAFKRDPANRGGVCAVGLWRYSRHPNYFFEWLVWVAYLIFALGSPVGWLAAIGPASILFLLLRVTGIPLTEAQSLRSKGEAYRRYQARTSAFVPWFSKTQEKDPATGD
jgi:steroid 5-alpha reductase family enzyme